jgi:predicted nucleotidyltransferase
MVQKDAINIVKQFISNLRNDGIEIKFAYLFGSFARNEGTAHSDIDVLLIADIFDTDDDYLLSKPWLPKYRNDFRIEPIAIGTKRFLNDDVTPIIQIAKQEGIKISA